MTSTTGPSRRDRMRGFFRRPASPLPVRQKVAPSNAPTLASARTRVSSGILADSLDLLAEDERATIRTQLSPSTITADAAVDEVYGTAHTLRHSCGEKRWRYGDREVSISKQADKVLRLLDRLKSVGDVVANVDPIHIGLPWAGIRVLLHVALADGQQQAALLTGMELSLYTTNRLKVYLDFHTRLSPSLASDNLRKALVNLFAHVLQFLARAIQVYQQSGVTRLAQAVWNSDTLVSFEEKCDQLCGRAAEEASNCDRQVVQQVRERLDNSLKSLGDIHNIQESLVKIHDKADLAKLVTAKEATYDSTAEGDLPRCLPGTRVELLREIFGWTSDRSSKRIFWLCGKAGTGKSTISRTVAQTLDKEGRLGATFFFKRGRADRSHANLFFPTIARQLADKLPNLGHAVAAALERDSLLCEKHLTKQFDELLLQPMLSGLQGNTYPEDIFIIMDALDECDSNEAIETILKLLKRIETITTARIRIFVTSRPESPIISEFRNMGHSLYQDVRLEEVQAASIKSDLLLFFEHEFTQIKRKHPIRNLYSSLPAEWPENDEIRLLVDKAYPLFIAAFTLCRQISRTKKPQEQLSILLAQEHSRRSLTGLANTYSSVLKQATSANTEISQMDSLASLQTILGPLVLLNDPLSATALSRLLDVTIEDIGAVLTPLQSVLSIPEKADGSPDPLEPIKLFHLSFRDFLVDPALQGEHDFWINESEAQVKLTRRCVDLLQANTLKEDVCDVKAPGTRRADVAKRHVAASISEDVAYACRYWVQHLVASGQTIKDDEFVHDFLRKHFLHWMEAMSWLGKTSDVIHDLEALRSITSVDSGAQLLRFVNDASRVAVRNRAIVDEAPLQTYFSTLLFLPSESIVRGHFSSDLGRYLHVLPSVPEQWSAERIKLEGHESVVCAVAISADGKTVASGSRDKTVRLWSTATGEQLQKLEGHTHWVTAVAISADSKIVASGSGDKTVRLWSTATGEQLQKLEGHEHWVTDVAISADGKTVASGSRDKTVRLWSTATGEQLQKLEGHEDTVTAVAISADGKTVASGSDDKTVRLWSTATGEQLQKLEGHTHWVTAVAISADSKIVASGSGDKTVRLWSTATGEQLQKLEGHEQWVTDVAISADGKTVASGSRDKTVRLWSTATGEQLQKLEGHEDWVTAVAISADGKTVASGSRDETVRLWSTATGEQLQKLEGHEDTVTTVAISTDGKIVASGSGDKTVRLWSTTTGEQTRCFKSPVSLSKLRFTSDGKALEINAKRFDLAKSVPPSRALASSSQVPAAVLHSPWVRYNGSDMLWLPYEYRGTCSATSSALLVVGQASGAISIFSFKT